MTTLRAGTLRDRITIQRRTGGKDGWGSPLPEGWEEVAKLWANVRHLSGSAAIKAGADVSVVRASIRIRRRSDVDAGMRVLFGTQVYEIEAVLPGEAREHIDLVCKLNQGPKK